MGAGVISPRVRISTIHTTRCGAGLLLRLDWTPPTRVLFLRVLVLAPMPEYTPRLALTHAVITYHRCVLTCTLTQPPGGKYLTCPPSVRTAPSRRCAPVRLSARKGLPGAYIWRAPPTQLHAYKGARYPALARRGARAAMAASEQ